MEPDTLDTAPGQSPSSIDHDKIISDHPLLYKYCKGLEIGQGWYELVYELSSKIEAILDDQAQAGYDHCYAAQVKEKYGTLRFYMASETDEISKLIEEYENESMYICETCGKPGKWYDNGWCHTHCEEHRKWK